MGISAKFKQELNVSDTPSLGLDLVANQTFTHRIGTNGQIADTLDADSTVPATKVASDAIGLTAGAATIDLTSLTGPGGAVSFSGLKLQLAEWRARSTNTDNVVIKDGATNGYNLFGDSSGQITLTPGASILAYYPDNLADVGGSAKTIDLSSSDVDAIVDYILVAG